MKTKLYFLLFGFLCLLSCSDETKVQSVALDPTEMTLEIGESRQIEMIISPISAIIYNPTSWKSSNPNVAQVDNKGNVTAIYAGECIITGKTKYHEAYCKVTVVAPEYNLNFTSAILFDEGIVSATDKRNLVLRLYDEGLTIDSTGTMYGNGLFLNINLYASADTDGLPLGEYNVADSIGNFAILPGALKQEGNAYYATGSYLGQYTDNGLSALFITDGNIEITDNYTIVCSLSGAQTEIINATFNGDIPIYDTSAEQETTTIEYSNVAVEDFYINDSKLNHFKISFYTSDTTVAFVARVPISINTLPLGSYYTNDEPKAYTLIPEYCSIDTQQKTTQIATATLKVGKNSFEATFIDENGIKYLLRSPKKQENIAKQRCKNFVY
jgi:hypothetical protein